MPSQLRILSKRRIFYYIFAGFVGTYLILISGIFQTLEDSKNKYADERIQMHYNLPALSEYIDSIEDLDFKRALKGFLDGSEQIPVGTPNVNLVIASTWRSGSTLLGEILSSYPGVFYHYEPLMSYGLEPITSNEAKKSVQNRLLNLLNCKYAYLGSYLEYAYGNPDIFRRNERLWKLCSGMPRFKCYMSFVIDRLCSLFPIHIMKVVRMRLALLKPLLEVPNTKILWLVRDPRATISSRIHSVDWCTSNYCKDPQYLCKDLNDDYYNFKNLQNEYPDKLMILRYEDLTKKPQEKTKAVLDFIGLGFHENVDNYIKSHFNEEIDAPWSTVHDALKRMNRWMKVSPWKEVIQTQHMCRSEMGLLGYRTFDNEVDYSSGNAVKMLNL